MKKLLAIILTTLVVMVLAVGCSKDEPETSPTVSTPQAITSTPTAVAVTTQPPASTPATTTTPPTTPAVTTTSSPSPSPTTTTPGSEEPADLPVYSWEEAIDHIGETATVTGPIIGTINELSTNNVPALRMGGPQGPVVIFSPPLEPPPEDMYVGHTISVTVSNINPWSVLNEYLPDDIDMTKTKKVSNDMTAIYVRLYVTDLSQIEIIE